MDPTWPTFSWKRDMKFFGMVRRASTENFERIEHLHGKITLIQGDLLDELSLIKIMETVMPDEILQPRGNVIRPHILGPAYPHRRVHRHRCDANAGSNAQGMPSGEILPGVEQ